MGYYVGAISQNSVWKAFDQNTAPFTSNTFQVNSTGGALVVEVDQYYRAKYELPQGSILAKIMINDRVVVEDVAVTDRLIPGYNTIHKWSFTYDISAADLTKISGDDNLVIYRVLARFYLNEDGLRTVSIAEQDVSNAFNFFKQEILSYATVGGSRTFTFAAGIKHDFTNSDPFVTDLYSSVNELDTSDRGTSGLRIFITPLIDPNGFGITALFKIEIKVAFFDREGLVNSVGDNVIQYPYTISDTQLSLSYKGLNDKAEKTFGPVTYGPAKAYDAEAAVLDDLPTTSYVDGTSQFDPSGIKGFYFLQPTVGRVGWASNMQIGELLTKLSLSLYFSVQRDVTAEILVQAHSDLTVADQFVH